MPQDQTTPSARFGDETLAWTLTQVPAALDAVKEREAYYKQKQEDAKKNGDSVTADTEAADDEKAAPAKVCQMFFGSRCLHVRFAIVSFNSVRQFGANLTAPRASLCASPFLVALRGSRLVCRR